MDIYIYVCVYRSEHPSVYIYRIDRDCTVENGACTGMVRSCWKRKWQKRRTRERVGTSRCEKWWTRTWGVRFEVIRG